MSRGDRVYVSTAFMPFRQRRIDAVADLLVAGLRANNFHAERLRVPVDVRAPRTAAAAAAAAALIDASWAHRMIDLEFPCMHLPHGRAASWRVRGGLDCDLTTVVNGGLGLRHVDIAGRFDRDWAEPGAAAGATSVIAPAPAGVLTDHLVRRGVLAVDGVGALIVSLDPMCDGPAQDLASAHERSHVVGSPPDAARDARGLEASLWDSLDKLSDGSFAGIHVFLPGDVDSTLLAAIAGSAGALESWTTVGRDGRGTTNVVRQGSGATTEEVSAAWTHFARDLVP